MTVWTPAITPVYPVLAKKNVEKNKLKNALEYFPFINFENPLYLRPNVQWLGGCSKRPPNETKL
jgi:hypothetical protein